MEQEKLYSPLNFYLRNYEEAAEGQYDEIDYWRDEITREEAFGYLSDIKAYLADDRRHHYDTERGLAEYLDEPLGDKVQSLVPYVELHGDSLWMVAELQLNTSLDPEEMAGLKDWWEGQLSDGVGESWEQHEIKLKHGELYMEPWTPGDDFFIATQAEFDRRMGIECPAQETPAQAALHEQDASDGGETAALREQLVDRLDDNLSDYFTTLRGVYNEEIVGMSSEIGAQMDAHYYLTEIHNFHASELQYLLQFENPLAVVADEFAIADVDRSGTMWTIFDRQEALKGDYPRASDDFAAKKKAPAPALENRDALLEGIAKQHCHVETLETRESDSLDFHDVSVWSLKDALEAAFKAGAEQQLAKESRAVAELPDAVADVEALRQKLSDRLEQNYADMMNDYRSDISDSHLPTNEFVELADRISRASDVYEYLIDTSLPEDQVAYLLNFQCPLEVVADRWPAASNGLVDMDAVMEDICDKEDALQGGYALASEAAPAREETPAPAQGKQSLLAGLREAQAKTEPPKDKSHTHKSGPEL